MINAIGKIVLISYRDYKRNRILFKSTYIYVKVIESKKVIDMYNRFSFELTCYYSILIHEKYDCKTLHDYVSHVYPTLNKYLDRIVRTEVHDLTYAHPSIKHVNKVIKNLPIGE